MSKGGSSGSSGGGATTVTNTTQPPAAAMTAYQGVLSQASDVASQPLNQYAGPTTAGFTPQQMQAFATVQNAQGVADPYINAAAQYQSQAATPITPTQFSAAAVDQYQSPYTQSVVDATQAQFNNQNAQAAQGLTSNAISQGAFGGDRDAVAQAVLANQQQLAQAPTIAGLYNQGYTQAQGEFNNQQQAGMTAQQDSASLANQAASGMANLGTQAQADALAGASANLTAGNQQQQLAQTELTNTQNQFNTLQQYPFQTTGWLSNIATGIGSGMGTNSSTTTSAPSTLSQAAGLGAGALGIIGGTDGFGSDGWLTSLFADGGRIAGMAHGGRIGFDAGGTSAAQPFAVIGGQSFNSLQDLQNSWDESAYMAANPDVANMYSAGANYMTPGTQDYAWANTFGSPGLTDYLTNGISAGQTPTLGPTGQTSNYNYANWTPSSPDYSDYQQALSYDNAQAAYLQQGLPGVTPFAPTGSQTTTPTGTSQYNPNYMPGVNTYAPTAGMTQPAPSPMIAGYTMNSRGIAIPTLDTTGASQNYANVNVNPTSTWAPPAASSLPYYSYAQPQIDLSTGTSTPAPVGAFRGGRMGFDDGGIADDLVNDDSGDDGTFSGVGDDSGSDDDIIPAGDSWDGPTEHDPYVPPSIRDSMGHLTSGDGTSLPSGLVPKIKDELHWDAGHGNRRNLPPSELVHPSQGMTAGEGFQKFQDATGWSWRDGMRHFGPTAKSDTDITTREYSDPTGSQDAVPSPLQAGMTQADAAPPSGAVPQPPSDDDIPPDLQTPPPPRPDQGAVSGFAAPATAPIPTTVPRPDRGRTAGLAAPATAASLADDADTVRADIGAMIPSAPVKQSRPQQQSAPVTQSTPADATVPDAAPKSGLDTYEIAKPDEIKMPTRSEDDAHRAAWMALAAAGFGAAAGTSPSAMTNIGQGALAGLKQYGTEKAQLDAHDDKVMGLQAKNIANTTEWNKSQVQAQRWRDEAAHQAEQDKLDAAPTYTYKDVGQGTIMKLDDSGDKDPVPYKYPYNPSEGGGVSSATERLTQAILADNRRQRDDNPNIPELSYADAVRKARGSRDNSGLTQAQALSLAGKDMENDFATKDPAERQAKKLRLAQGYMNGAIAPISGLGSPQPQQQARPPYASLADLQAAVKAGKISRENAGVIGRQNRWIQ